MDNNDGGHESRLRAMERRLDTHEAICGERYNNIISGGKELTENVKSLHTALQKRIDYLIVGIVLLAFVMAVGPEIAERLLGGIAK